MKRGLFITLLIVLITAYLPVVAQSDTCLSPRFFGGQFVRVTGSVDAGGLPFRSQPDLTAPVEGLIPLDNVVESRRMNGCMDGRNWYSVWYTASEDEAPVEVWVVDGDGQSYWLEPEPDCPAFADKRIHIFPSPPAYAERLIVDGYDEATNTIRFAANHYPASSEPYEWHFFTLDLDTGLITQTDYWHSDLITPELTDRLGIAEQVFGEREVFNTVYVSPDRTKILYRTTNPQIPDCAHGCVTETLWIANSDGSNPIALSEFYGGITRIVWGDDGRIYLSLYPLEVWGPESTLTVCADGSCAFYNDELILEGRSLPFEFVRHMPVWSPNGEWIAVSMGSEQLLSEGIPSTGFILENDGDRYIQLPYNGGTASPIVWLDDDTILYPVLGIGWDGEDYGLPRDFYTQDAIWEFHLDFEYLTYQRGDRLTYWVSDGDWYDRMFDSEQTYHIIAVPGGAVVYSWRSLDIYCFARG